MFSVATIIPDLLRHNDEGEQGKAGKYEQEEVLEGQPEGPGSKSDVWSDDWRLRNGRNFPQVFSQPVAIFRSIVDVIVVCEATENLEAEARV